MPMEFEKVDAYEPDRSLKGKLRRRLIRLAHRRPAKVALERPMVSFSFDDAPATACEAGARALEARGLRGTYYFAAGLTGRDGPMGRYATGEDARRLHEAGHEIACHTYSHLDCGQSSQTETLADVDRNAESLAAWGAGDPVSFAYPYGDVAAPAKTALSGRFKTLRALHHGLITDGADLNQTPAVGIEGEDGETVAKAWLDKAKARKAWLILYTHDVAGQPSQWGCTTEALERLIDRALADGFDVVTVAEGSRRIGL
ncbi:oligosaccharide deacetylase HfsH [Caulobacter vibrioides]|uniref:Chitooligosaccharide deacetylase n=2 Tax=Caulobacter vibrioides TaxID=155892 RepID=Q9A5L9_CAUVC|nr:oligosaccharide deacetylase HfsH [Caulobacter vibrioides]YP_002517883.1 oligosaccharide deacetylase hfsH [Caulobacter vibrioides NA1000]AAK24399.1 HfsH [Caulobacter vibrioides CB15]ACL95975.1 oligosaccharide deacetylase hfsH [Caulobacter vibrioides NA1000]ATC29282.1 polysaccharide deacetylase [Caulobacter vibrioides]QXZ50793.1 oligosaccharide deacetylase HfsH [Caulobacter vibrioides]